jgi:hypothetical protein
VDAEKGRAGKMNIFFPRRHPTYIKTCIFINYSRRELKKKNI